MIIAVDAGMLGIADDRLKVGVYTVCVNLLQQLGKIDTTNSYTLYSFDPIDRELMKSFGPRMVNKVLRPKFGWFSFRLPLELALHPSDIFLGLGQGIPISRSKSIGFIYDLGFIHHPELYPGSAEKMTNMTGDMIKRSSHIITISRAVKDDIVHTYHVDGNNISVAYPGVDPLFTPTGKAYVAKHPYFLYVGSLKLGKNIPTLIRAFAQFREKYDYDLYIAGSDYWLDPAIDEAIGTFHVQENVKRLGYVSNADLATYYRGAVAFVSPSFVEGFCLPAVEAMASGCPVIVSDISVFQEVIGAAGMFVDPKDADMLTESMYAMEDKKIRTAFMNKGLAQSKKYTWNSFAEKMYTCIQRVGS